MKMHEDEPAGMRNEETGLSGNVETLRHPSMSHSLVSFLADHTLHLHHNVVIDPAVFAAHKQWIPKEHTQATQASGMDHFVVRNSAGCLHIAAAGHTRVVVGHKAIVQHFADCRRIAVQMMVG